MTPYYQAPGVELYLGRFQDVMAQLPLDTFDAVITDPPYPREYLKLWADLGLASCHVLKRGGSLLAITPHYALPEILPMVNQWLKYRWIICMSQAHGGQHARMAMGIQVAWKPVIWWVKGAYPSGRGYRIDWFASVAKEQQDGPDKLHKWQQGLSWAQAMLKYVPDGGRVIDPMMGAGTLVVAARDAGYPVVGIDSDPACLAMTVKRLGVAP
jgi:hypothetical protein